MRAPMRAAFCAAVAALALFAAAPSPQPTPPRRIDLTKIQPKALLPKVPLHTEYVVAVNNRGQVTHIMSIKASKDRVYNLQTAGNALQTFIRTPDGKAVSGSYRLTYDYSPKTTRIHREVVLVRAGGVDPNAPGAVTKMLEDVRKNAKAHPAPVKPATPAPERSAAMTPGPQPTGTLHLPSLQQILKTPAP